MKSLWFLIVSLPVWLLSQQITDPQAAYSGAGGGGTVETNFIVPQTFEYNLGAGGGTDNGVVVLDTTGRTGINGHWVLRLNDYVVSRDPGGSDPGDPRMAISDAGRVWTMTDFLMSAMTVGDIDDGTFWPIAPFETSSGVDALSGCGIGVAAFMGDTDGPAMQVTCVPTTDEGSIFAGGTRVPGSGIATLKFQIDQDGAIFMGSVNNPGHNEALAMWRPDKQLEPMLWRSGSFTPNMGGTVQLWGDTVVKKLGQVSGGAVSNQGTAGATTYTYKVTAISPSGFEALPSAEITTATGHAVLDGTNFNRITWTRIRGTAVYKIYRTVGGDTQGVIGQVLGNAELMRYDDNAEDGGDATTPPTLDATGNLTVDGVVKGDRVVYNASRAGITADEYLNANGVQFVSSPVVTGFRMHRAGSIIGLSMNGRTTAFTANTTADSLEVHAGGVVKAGCVATYASAFSANDQVRNISVTFSRGTHTFTSGTTISLYYNGGGGVHTTEAHATMEVIFDN